LFNPTAVQNKMIEANLAESLSLERQNKQNLLNLIKNPANLLV
jgi:hypothetical protein